MKPVYSGNKSRKLWNTINKLKGKNWASCYTAFCILQNVEEMALNLLRNAINKEEKNR